ncbi:MAG: 1-O-methyltransferase [Actinomycetota bacterium]|jgi:predicted O-methyltransferase YrrM|nr:1-O-methyltransferase [Actinomycetota bacterium]
MERPGLVTLDPSLLEIATSAKGFMPDDEGLALYEAALKAATRGPLLEIGSYCGKSAVYLGAAAKEAGSTLYSVDHHRGSEENQPGQEYHDPDLVDEEGRVDTLPWFRSTIEEAGLANWVIGIVGSSPKVARAWATPLSMVFIDGGHSSAAATADYEAWTPKLMSEGLLAIHDVFPDPADGGRPPFEIYQRALVGAFEDVSACGSLRVLRKIGEVA